ncbi:MAG TPA: NAD(P)/FAD-dependent oxidoreductase [Polyangiaceae bacterium]|nr:NAD(P)/FAD-dependent oxidoreductase [Polyangiaceae bacterium]
MSSNGHGARTYAVIGGGMMGLTVALRLAEQGHAVTLYEASNRLGGLAAPWQLGPITWDRHYHVTLLSDSFTRGLFRDLALEDEMNWVTTRTGFASAGRVVSMSNALEYLRLPGLSPIDKGRLAATILYGSRVDDWSALERTPVEDWLVRLSGRSTFDKLWRPLLEAKLGDGWRESSAAFIWATIQRLYAARRTGLKKEMFGYVPGGYSRVVERFTEYLTRAGVKLRVGQPVSRIVTSPQGPRVETPSGSETFDRVVFTTTPRTVARLCPELSSQERATFESVAYQGVVCASLLMERPLAGYYLTYLTDAGLPFTAVVEMSAFVDPAEFGGKSLVYLPKYAPAGDAVFEQDDATLEREFTTALRRLFPEAVANDVLAFRVSRVKEVFPLPVLGYSSKLPPLTTSLPGVTAVSSAHIVNGTLNVNDTLRVAERAARSLRLQDGLRIHLD